MPRKQRELRWGETPWDELPREDLLREVQRMYAAIVSLDSCMQIQRCSSPHSPYWTKGGSGFHALEEARMILEPLHEQFSSENIYRAFFRYAVDLLFAPELGFGWTACDGCTHLYGDDADLPEERRMLGKPCPDCAAKGRHFIRRRLEWRDMAKSSSKPDKGG